MQIGADKHHDHTGVEEENGVHAELHVLWLESLRAEADFADEDGDEQLHDGVESYECHRYLDTVYQGMEFESIDASATIPHKIGLLVLRLL